MTFFLGDLPSWVAVVLTYYLHAAFFTLLAALLVKHGTHGASSQNAIYKSALVGPLLTVLLTLTVQDHLSTLHVVWRTVPLPSLGQFSDVTPQVASSRHAWLERFVYAGPTAWLVVSLVAGACMLGLVRFVVSAARFWFSLRARTLVDDPRLCRLFEHLRRRTAVEHVRLTESCAISGPMVLGGREVCISRGQLATLTDGEVDAVFAHELAHLERSDGLWFPLVGLVEALSGLSPLTHWVSARFRQTAELACDDRAVELTHAPLDLATALTRMAELAAHRPALQGAWGPAVAGVGSARVSRVRRLVEWSTTPSSTIAVSTLRKQSVAVLLTTLLALSLIGWGRVFDARRAPPAHFAPRAARKDVSADPHTLALELQTLALREAALRRQLVALTNSSSEPTARATQMLELAQDLRHAEAQRAWTAGRLFAAQAPVLHAPTQGPPR